jgi:hypothetical protein
MSRIRSVACTVGLGLLIFAGCKSFDGSGLLFLQKDANGDRVVAGSLDAVAESARSTLTQLGFVATTSRQGDAVRISCKTSAGSQFTLVLTREPKPGNSAVEQTRVRIEWDGKSDDQTSLQVLSQVEASTRK